MTRLVVLAAALAAVGCGDTNPSSDAGPGDSAAPPAPDSAAPADIAPTDAAAPDATEDAGPPESWRRIAGGGDSPLALFGCAMVYDSKRQRVLVVGGRSGAGLEAEIWAIEGDVWRDLTPAPNPFPARMVHAAAYDAARDRLVVFGGLADLKPPYPDHADTWEWDGERWIEAKPAAAPPARAGHAMAFDAARGVVVLFGGTDNQSEWHDTWTWDGASWTELEPKHRPPSRFNTRATYDHATRRLIVFGGQSIKHGNLGDAWAWDGDDWTPLEPSGPAPAARGFHALAYDTSRSQLLLFGGADDLPPFTSGKLFGGLWALDGSSWTEVIAEGAQGPAPRVGHRLVYDASKERLLLFGGMLKGGKLLADLWELRR